MKEEETKDKILIKLITSPLGIIFISVVWGLLAYWAYLLFIASFPGLPDLFRLISN